MAKEVYEWDLTDDEATQLHAFFLRRMGGQCLLRQLQRQLGIEIEEEACWWEKVRARLNIPGKYGALLAASHEEKRVWVKGKLKHKKS